LSLTITNPTLTNPADKTEIEENFDDVVDKFNGGITTSDLSASAGITNAQLANSVYEFVLNMTVTADFWTAAEDNDLAAFAGLPEDTNNTSYTIIAADYVYRGHVTAATSGAEFSVQWGYFNAGTWTTTSTIVSTTNFTTGSATSVSANLTLNTTTVTTSTTNRHFFAVLSTDVVEGAGTRPLADQEEMLVVSLKLKRTNGLRS
jgi:hypothetical protein